MDNRIFLYDDVINAKTRFVSFAGENIRFDLGIITTDRFYGKQMVLDLQSNRFAIIGEDDLAEEGYLEYVFQLSQEDAADLRSFLEQIV